MDWDPIEWQNSNGRTHASLLQISGVRIKVPRTRGGTYHAKSWYNQFLLVLRYLGDFPEFLRSLSRQFRHNGDLQNIAAAVTLVAFDTYNVKFTRLDSATNLEVVLSRDETILEISKHLRTVDRPPSQDHQNRLDWSSRVQSTYFPDGLRQHVTNDLLLKLLEQSIEIANVGPADPPAEMPDRPVIQAPAVPVAVAAAVREEAAGLPDQLSEQLAAPDDSGPDWWQHPMLDQQVRLPPSAAGLAAPAGGQRCLLVPDQGRRSPTGMLGQPITSPGDITTQGTAGLLNSLTTSQDQGSAQPTAPFAGALDLRQPPMPNQQVGQQPDQDQLQDIFECMDMVYRIKQRLAQSVEGRVLLGVLAASLLGGTLDASAIRLGPPLHNQEEWQRLLEDFIHTIPQMRRHLESMDRGHIFLQMMAAWLLDEG